MRKYIISFICIVFMSIFITYNVTPPCDSVCCMEEITVDTIHPYTSIFVCEGDCKWCLEEAKWLTTHTHPVDTVYKTVEKPPLCNFTWYGETHNCGGYNSYTGDSAKCSIETQLRMIERRSRKKGNDEKTNP